MKEQEHIQTTTWARMLNVLVFPGDVFEEVVSAPLRLVNWRAPTLLVVLVTIISIQFGPFGASFGANLCGTNSTSDPFGRGDLLAAWWPVASSLNIFAAAFGGSIWSAFVLWFIGRVFLGVRFSWLKTLEIVGLIGTVLTLGLIVTSVTAAIFGDIHACPAFSLFPGKLDSATALFQAFGAFDLFYIWSTAVMAIGLSKLSGVSVKESAFWVFSYWFAIRIGLIILA